MREGSCILHGATRIASDTLDFELIRGYRGFGLEVW